MILNSGMFCYWWEFVGIQDSNKNLIVFKLFTKDFWFWNMYIKNKDTYFINTIKGITSHIAWLNKIYSASVALKAIYACNLLNDNTGHPK